MPQTVTETFQIGGMTCVNCQYRLQRALIALKGVESAEIAYAKGTGEIRYRPDTVTRDDIARTAESLGYTAAAKGGRQSHQRALEAAGILIVILALYTVLNHFGFLGYLNAFPTAEAGMGYGMLFVIGLLTSVHCVAMCGGINLSQSIPAGAKADRAGAALRPGLLYNVGRVISYTVVGGLVGALGSVVRFSGAAQGIVQLAAGVFMVLMGANMLGIFPALRRFVPRLPASLTGRVQRGGQGNGPLIVGLLNGLMPCGPLQAMQLYALSTGSPLQGALSMLLFSLGTVPLMLGLSAFSSMMSKKFSRRMVTVGAVLVVVLGVSMFGNGLSLSGLVAVPAVTGGEEQTARTAGDIQTVETALSPGGYQPITVQAGIPVRWTITAEPGTINGCNNRLQIPAYGVELSLQTGENVIEFTPDESGTFPYSCWMGMIRSTITVTESGA